MKAADKKRTGRTEKAGFWKRTAAALLAALVLAGAAGCAGQGASSGRTGSAQEQGAEAAGAAVTGQETAAEAKTEAAGAAKSAAEPGSGGAQDIEIPEEPYVREDGGVSINVFAMDTYMTLLAYGEGKEGDDDGTAQAREAVLAAAAEIHRLDDMLSTGNPDSEISKLNAAGGGEASEVVLDLIERSQQLRQETGGLFEIAIYPVMKLWGFPTQDYHVPQKTGIEEALKLADASAITISRLAKAQSGTTAADTPEPAANQTAAVAEPAEVQKENAGETAAESLVPTVTFGIPGMEIDLGGIAKGYTSSRVMEIFKEHGVKHGLVSLGGNVQALGSKADGKPWRVAIQNPESDADYLGILDIVGKCVITSGGYERFFVEDGVRYHHIIDPRTGYPADSGLLSATILSEDGALADGLSTSLFIMGKDGAEKYWRAHPDTFDYILEDEEGALYVTKGAAAILETDKKTVVIQ